MSTTSDNLVILNVAVIDWYDGVLSALLDLGDDAAPHLCLCAAWSPDYDERVYGLVPVAVEVAAELRNLLGRSSIEEHWDEITRIMNAAVGDLVGMVLVIATDAAFKEVLGKTRVSFDEIPELVCGKDRAEKAYDEPRLFAWLERLGLPKPMSWREKEQLEGETE